MSEADPATHSQALQLLERAGVSYREVHHGAVFHVGDVSDANLDFPVVKTLLLHIKRTGSYCMCVLLGADSLDIHAVAGLLGVSKSKVSFAQANDLSRLLGVAPGTVTPLALPHNADCRIRVLLDVRLQELDKVGVHPNVNTSTVLMAFDDLLRTIQATGHEAQVAGIAQVAKA